jgi:predicted Zn-dependent peptidase
VSLFVEPRLSVLANGVRIVTETMPSVASAALGIYVGAGARAESAREHGIAHLLEHMAFKGTRRRSARAIVEEIEAVGGDINAATSMEDTGYYARTLSADAGLGLDILADIVTDSVLEPTELKREQTVIRQEIAAVQDTPDDLVFEHLQAAAFAGHTLGRSILGTDESVSSFTRADVQDFLGHHYRGSRTIVAAAGDIDHDALVARAEESLAGLPALAPAPVEPARFVGGKIREERDLEQVNIAIAFPGVSIRDERVYAARVFASVLGGGMASRLFQEVREKRGLCYTVSAFHWAYSDIGLLGMHAGTDPDDAPTLVPLLVEELEKAARGVSAAEVARAKAQLKASLLMSLESPAARADRLARQLLVFGETRSIQAITAAVDAVDVDQVRAFGASALASGTSAFASVGPIRERELL